MLRYAKVRDVKDIQRGTELSAGIDFFIPNDWNEGCDKYLQPGERVLIPSGIHIDMIGSGLADFALIFFNKSGVGSKKGLDILACVVDETIIETNKGKFTAKTLTKEFIQKNKIKVKGFDENRNSYGFFDCDGFRVSGWKECIRLEFDNGEILECSEDHLIYTLNKGWKLAEDLTEEDELLHF